MIDTSYSCLPHGERIAECESEWLSDARLVDWAISGGSQRWFSLVALIALEHHAEGIADGIATGDHAIMRGAAKQPLCRANPLRRPSFAAIISGCHRWLSLVVVIDSGFCLCSWACCWLPLLFAITACLAASRQAVMRRCVALPAAAVLRQLSRRHLRLSSVAVIGGYHWWLSSIAVFISAAGHVAAASTFSSPHLPS